MNNDDSILMTYAIKSGNISNVIELYAKAFTDNYDTSIQEQYNKYIYKYSYETSNPHIIGWILNKGVKITTELLQDIFSNLCCTGNKKMATHLIVHNPEFSALICYNNCEPMRLASYAKQEHIINWLLDINPYACGV